MKGNESRIIIYLHTVEGEGDFTHRKTTIKDIEPKIQNVRHENEFELPSPLDDNPATTEAPKNDPYQFLKSHCQTIKCFLIILAALICATMIGLVTLLTIRGNQNISTICLNEIASFKVCGWFFDILIR